MLFTIFLQQKKGELKSEYKKLIGKIIIVVDIGGGTIDIAGVEINEKKDGIPLLNPVFDLVDFIDAGVMNVTEAIVKELRLDGYEISAAELDLCIRENESILDDGNDVSKRADEGLEGLSQKAYTRVMNNINSLTPAKKRAVKEVFVTGGGALMSGNEKMTSMGDKIIELVEPLSFEGMISTDPLFDGVNGMKKVIDQDVAAQKKLSKEISSK